MTADLLTEHMERFVVPGSDALVFANTVGSPLIASSFWQHHFSKALQATGVACRFHDVRHTSVALAIAEGAHPKAIQTRMGHSSINVTLDRYGPCSLSSTRRSRPRSASDSTRSGMDGSASSLYSASKRRNAVHGVATAAGVMPVDIPQLSLRCLGGAESR